ncbi:uncharacterized protein LOC129752067 [Uranotaenia lowii]|uniref:uncharacterized protein LOC129752067 n=1 Tax=Uranotaenia lowii TaxID=190385 RepID=UPI0024791575|nr:uncharacterized protein LOC129752067 [Uranotaenia lowii]
MVQKSPVSHDVAKITVVVSKCFFCAFICLLSVSSWKWKPLLEKAEFLETVLEEKFSPEDPPAQLQNQLLAEWFCDVQLAAQFFTIKHMVELAKYMNSYERANETSSDVVIL